MRRRQRGLLLCYVEVEDNDGKLGVTHSADFSNAHNRHWQDAELLFCDRRWANADHLYGFSAECGLKAVAA